MKNVFFYIIFIIGISTTFGLEAKDIAAIDTQNSSQLETLSRHKRYVAFPEGSSFSVIFFSYTNREISNF